MATSFVNDLNALANSLSGAAQSVAGLYQTRVQLETMRLQSELQAKDDEFISRLYLPDDDPNKITIDNWETALNNHKADQENLLGNQRWKRVAGAVRTNLAPEVSGFNERFAKAMYTQERRYIQSETMGNVALASKRGDIDSVNNLMNAGIDSRLFDDPGAARLAQAKFVTEATVNKISMELASGMQDSEQLVTGQVLPVEGTARERAVRYINAKAEDPDAKAMLLAQERARADAATKSFNSMIEDQMKEDIRKAGKVNVGLIKASIEDAKAGGYVNMADIKAAESRYDSYVFEQSVYPVESAISTHKQLYQEDVVPEKAETTLINNIKAWANEPENKGNAQAQKYANDKIEEVRNYSKESKEGDGSWDVFVAEFDVRAARIKNLINNGELSPESGAIQFQQLASEAQKKAKSAGNEREAAAFLKTEARIRGIADDMNIAKTLGENGDLLLNSITSPEYVDLVSSMMKQNKMDGTDLGKALTDVSKNDAKASDKSQRLYTLWLQDVQTHARKFVATHKNITQEDLDKEITRYSLRQAEIMDLIPGNQFDMRTDVLFSSVEKEVAKVHSALESNPDMSVRGGTLTSTLIEQRDAVVNQLLSVNKASIPGAGTGPVLAKPVGDDLVVEVGGKQYTVDSVGGNLFLRGDQGQVIKLESQAELDLKANKARLAAEFVNNSSKATSDQRAAAEARLNTKP